MENHLIFLMLMIFEITYTLDEILRLDSHWFLFTSKHCLEMEWVSGWEKWFTARVSIEVYFSASVLCKVSRLFSDYILSAFIWVPKTPKDDDRTLICAENISLGIKWLSRTVKVWFIVSQNWGDCTSAGAWSSWWVFRSVFVFCFFFPLHMLILIIKVTFLGIPIFYIFFW